MVPHCRAVGGKTHGRARDIDVRRLLEAYPRIFFACHTRHVRDPETGGELSAHQASILDHLDEVDALSMTSLAEHMGVTVATMSLAIDRLEHRGYVRRDRDPQDGRRVLLRVTKVGARPDSRGADAQSPVRRRPRRRAARPGASGARGERPHAVDVETKACVTLGVFVVFVVLVIFVVPEVVR
ncbi:MAG: hypothetical protein DMF91_03070 [Acidobacteria bacterium]|nr:MAG: hypothetical protein DMF91_03070 [Acidobacteriota bacterium]